MAALLWSSPPPRFTACNLAMLCTLCLLSPWLLWSAALILPAVVGATMLSLAASCARDLLGLLGCINTGSTNNRQQKGNPSRAPCPPEPTPRGRLPTAESTPCPALLSVQQLQSLAQDLKDDKHTQPEEVQTDLLIKAAPRSCSSEVDNAAHYVCAATNQTQATEPDCSNPAAHQSSDQPPVQDEAPDALHMSSTQAGGVPAQQTSQQVGNADSQHCFTPPLQEVQEDETNCPGPADHAPPLSLDDRFHPRPAQAQDGWQSEFMPSSSTPMAAPHEEWQELECMDGPEHDAAQAAGPSEPWVRDEFRLQECVVDAFDELSEAHDRVRGLERRRREQAEQLQELQVQLEQERGYVQQELQQEYQREAEAHERVMADFRQQAPALVHRVLQKQQQHSVGASQSDAQRRLQGSSQVQEAAETPEMSASTIEQQQQHPAPPLLEHELFEQELQELSLTSSPDFGPSSDQDAASNDDLPLLEQLDETEDRLNSMQPSEALLQALANATTTAQQHCDTLRDTLQSLSDDVASVQRQLQECYELGDEAREEVDELVRLNAGMETDAGRELQRLRSRAGTWVKQHKQKNQHMPHSCSRNRLPGRVDGDKCSKDNSVAGDDAGQQRCPLPASPLASDSTTNSSDFLLGSHRRCGESERVVGDLMQQVVAGWLW